MTSIIISPTQSGKTRFIQNLAYDNYIKNISVFVFLRNITADMLQFNDRWKAKYDINLATFDKMDDSHSIYISLSNVAQLSKVYCMIEKINHPFIIILDEADLIYLDKQDSKQTSLLFNEIYKNKFIQHKYYITATPYSLIKHIPCVKCENIFTIEQAENYIGFNKIKNWHILGNCLKRITKESSVDKLLPVYEELLEYVLKREEHQIVLLNCTSIILIQEFLGKNFYNKFNINVIIDHGEYITVYSDNITFDLKSNLFTFLKIEKGYKYQFKKCHIKFILKLFKEQYNDTKVLIISGIKAGRGQSYKTEDTKEWHLTDLIYLPPVFQSCETLIQACGRITGIYESKDKKLHIWTTRQAKESIFEYMSYSDKFLNICKNSSCIFASEVANSLDYNGKFKIL